MAPQRGASGLLARRNAENAAPVGVRKRGKLGALTENVATAVRSTKPFGTSNANTQAVSRRKNTAIPVPPIKKARVTRAKATKADSVLSSQESNQPSSQSDASGSSQSLLSSQEKSGFSIPSSPTLYPTLPHHLRPYRAPVPAGVTDFDDKVDFYGSSTLVKDVFEYFGERECEFVCPDYMKLKLGSASVMKPSMRAILVDWMVEVQEEFELTHESLYLGVKLMDRFLSRDAVPANELQLVGAACMFIASKYEERIVHVPYLDQVQAICQNIYSASQVKKMERRIFRVVGFDLGMPTSYTFLRRFARTTASPNHELTLARYLLETSLLDYDLSVNCLESKKAAAALFLARKMVNVAEPIWTASMEWHTGLSGSAIRDDVLRIHRVMKTPPKSDLKVILNKYSHEVFSQVATVPLPDQV